MLEPEKIMQARLLVASHMYDVSITIHDTGNAYIVMYTKQHWVMQGLAGSDWSMFAVRL